MSTASLLRWIALCAGGELTMRGYLSGSAALCHAGAALVALALAALSWPTRARRAGLGLAGALLALTAVDTALALRAEPVREVRRFDCARPVAGRLAIVSAQDLAPGASPLAHAIELRVRGRDARVSSVLARARETALAQRRAGADVALAIPAEPRALAVGLRSIAGVYAIRAVEAGSLDGLLAERGCR
jgi:hypothetical protein